MRLRQRSTWPAPFAAWLDGACGIDGVWVARDDSVALRGPICLEPDLEGQISMAVLATTVITGLDSATYDQMAGGLGQALTATPGFRSHMAYPADSGWTVVEVWDSEAAFGTFFEAHVKADLPPGIEPILIELHSMLMA
jgi:hypothetical protein